MNRVLEIISGNNKRYKMAEDIMSKFYTCLNFRLEEKLIELTKIIDQSSPTKELQAMFPQLVNNIFASSFNSGWNLKTTCDTNKNNRHEYEGLINFLEPQGPMFRLCYKLMYDQQLKYDLPLNVLPLDLQMSLERGRYPQFYTDMLIMDSQTMNFVALALNPFDYYIFNFALYLVNNNQQQGTWENWNSVYFALACDYLMHFLPVDPSTPVLPHIPNYTGKVTMAAPLQTANRPLHTPSLLLIPDLCGMTNQHTSPQSQSRNEVWRSETVLQVFVDIWMSIEQFNARDDLFQRGYQTSSSSPERVRIVRVLVKHIHSYSAKHIADPEARSSALRKYARQIVCARAYHYIKYLVQTWPLDASFRLVLELWLSLIQPWRYADHAINQERVPRQNNNLEDQGGGALDATFTQFIAENFPSYTCILQLVLPRFMRMDLTAYKNTVMLFRLGKVFSQPHLVPILWNLEKAMTEGANIFHNHDNSFNISDPEQSYTYNGIPLHKWVAIAKQAISEMNMSTTFEYDPIWSETKTTFALEFVRKIHSSKLAADNIAEELNRKFELQHKGIWMTMKHWFMVGETMEEEVLLEECKKVPTFLNNCIHYFSNIFGLNESSLLPPDPVIGESILENSSFSNSMQGPQSITHRLRHKPTNIEYMGDPDLMPIMSYELTILVRILYQISSKINETYRNELINVYNSSNFWGYVAREVLEKPCTIRTYVKDIANHQNVVTQELPPRVSLRRLGSQTSVIWLTTCYCLLRLMSFSSFVILFIVVTCWLLFVFSKATYKIVSNLRT